MLIKCIISSKFRSCLLMIPLIFFYFSTNAQLQTISTVSTFTPNNSSGTVTFNIQNTNPYAVRIKNVRGIIGNATSTASIWYRLAPVNGAPGIISVATNWVEIYNGTVTGVATSGTTATLVPLVNNLDFIIPANTTYGFAVFTTGQRYFSMTTNVDFMTAGVKIIASSTASYGGGAPITAAPTNASRGWVGELDFERVSVASNDGGVAAIISPNTVTCVGPQNVVVKVQNFGNNILNNILVNWSLDGVLQTPYPITTPLDSAYGLGVNAINVTLGNINLGNQSVFLKAWTSIPNGVADTVNSNDTISSSYLAAMSGTYTINATLPASATNYISFSSIAAALNTRGVCGPVIVQVNNATYTDRLLLGNITGASATNTIKFVGNGAILQNAGSTTTNWSNIEFDGTKYVTINGLQIKSTGITYGIGVLMTNEAKYDSIKNCTFNFSSITSTGTNSAGIVISGSKTSITTTGINASNIYIGNNTITGHNTGGPYYGISIHGSSSSLMGSDSITIDNNIINAYYYPINILYSRNSKIINNEITAPTRTALTSAYPVRYYYCQGGEVSGNSIHDISTTSATTSSTNYGYYLYYTNSNSSTDTFNFYNNIYYGVGNYTSTNYGVYSYYNKASNIYNNSIIFDRPYTTTSVLYGIYSSGTTATNTIKNNLVYISGGNTGVKYGIYVNTASGIAPAGIQKNNVFINSTQAGTQYAYYYGSAYTTLNAFRTAQPTMEVGSVAVNPLIANIASGNLMPTNSALFGLGENLTNIVQNDFLGIPRPTNPTIGAFEGVVPIPNSLTALAITPPLDSTCGGLKPVKVVIKNVGSNIVTSAQIHWSVNGVQQPVYNYSGNLALPNNNNPLAIDTVTVGNFNFSTTINSQIVAYVKMPNNQIDIQPFNDTISKTLVPITFEIINAADAICMNKLLKMNIVPELTSYTGTYVWEASTNGTSWNVITSATQNIYSVDTLTSNRYFRAKLSSESCYTPTKQISVLNLDNIQTINDTICGPGVATVGVTPITGINMSWFNSLTSSTPLHTGNTFVTPNLTSNTTYYVSASNTTSNTADSLNLPITSSATTGSFHAMFLISATDNITLDELFIKCNNSVGTLTAWDIYYRPNNYQLTTSSNTNAAGWSVLSNVTGRASVGSTAFTKIGENLNLDIPAGQTYSFYIVPIGGATHQYTTPTIGTVTATNSDLNFKAGHRGSTLFSVSTSGGMPVIKAKYSKGCSGQMKPVQVIVNPLPQVNLGNDTFYCAGTSLTLANQSNNANVDYLWNNNANTSSITINASGQYSIMATDQINNCINYDTVNITLAPDPMAQLPSNIQICDGNSHNLDLGNVGSSYLWNTSAITQVIDVSATGIYTAKITNTFGCFINDTTSVLVVPNPIINLGNDTTVCVGTILTLDALNAGSTYVWSNGTTNQTNMVTNGLHTVTVTDVNGCQGIDNILIQNTYLPTADGFDFLPDYVNLGLVTFSPINPQDYTTLYWDFGDNTSLDYNTNPTHQYVNSGNYLVKLMLEGDCGTYYDSLRINVDVTTGIIKRDKDQFEVTVYPNPANDALTIKSQTQAVKINNVIIMNSLGSIVLKQKVPQEEKVIVDLQPLQAGYYMLQIETNKGKIIKKVSIIK